MGAAATTVVSDAMGLGFASYLQNMHVSTPCPIGTCGLISESDPCMFQSPGCFLPGGWGGGGGGGGGCSLCRVSHLTTTCRTAAHYALLDTALHYDTTCCMFYRFLCSGTISACYSDPCSPTRPCTKPSVPFRLSYLSTDSCACRR